MIVDNKIRLIVRLLFSLDKEEADLYFHLLQVTKNKPHNITKESPTYKRALALESKGLCNVLDDGDRASVRAIEHEPLWKTRIKHLCKNLNNG
jgi:hypothetical protein